MAKTFLNVIWAILRLQNYTFICGQKFGLINDIVPSLDNGRVLLVLWHVNLTGGNHLLNLIINGLFAHAAIASWVPLVSKGRSCIAVRSHNFLGGLIHKLGLAQHLLLHVLRLRLLKHYFLLLLVDRRLDGLEWFTLSLLNVLGGPEILGWCWLQQLHRLFVLLVLLIKQAWQMHISLLFDLHLNFVVTARLVAPTSG
jgi:hypothetical protein